MLLLLLRRRASLEGHLLGSLLLLLELLALLPWEARVLRLLRLRLLSEALRLAREASKLLLHWLHWPSSEARRLRCQSALEAAGLLEGLLLLLLPILRLPRSGTVPTP